MTPEISTFLCMVFIAIGCVLGFILSLAGSAAFNPKVFK